MRYCMMAVVALLLCACRGGKTGGESAAGDTLKLKYAQYINIVEHEGYTVATLSDPWNVGKTLHTYVLVPSDRPLPPSLPKGSVVRTPLQKAVVATSVHCGLIGQMGRQEAIAGVCDVQYINLPFVQEGVKQGRIADCGSGLQPTLESIIDLQPDAIFLSPFQNSGGYGRIEELSVPIIETSDYMESSALGRAEWMRFYGMLFGATQQTDSIFQAVEENYGKLCRQAKSAKSRPTLLMDKLTGSVWYVPGGQSTVGKVIADANIAYPWADDKHSGSLSLPFETILEKGANADLWLFRFSSTVPFTPAMLLQDNPGYSQFKAFKSGQLFGCNTVGSTFYEETPFHPDLLLRDFICIAHPDLGLGDPKYFIKIGK
ncbi:MAG: ABC transporter substrate-binding protein [Prevotella sp.]|nr:ABC transporter substrate-binding protein [Prevotella sp.]